MPTSMVSSAKASAVTVTSRRKTTMKNLQPAHSVITLVALIAAILVGCSDLKDPLPDVSTASLSVHPDGWITPASANFHGKSIREDNWDMRDCQPCHGRLFDGGISKASCRTCHTKPGGPENCTTCHGSVNNAPPPDLSNRTDRAVKSVGAHQTHVSGTSFAAAVSCAECHSVPSTVYDPGHVDSESPAEVVFNAGLSTMRTGVVPGGPRVTPHPSYDPTTAKCSNTYCHGAFVNGNGDFTPVWNDASGAQMACGTCHGDVTKTSAADRALPKTAARGGTHPNYTACYICHADVVDANVKIINSSKHINGKLNVAGEERSF